MGEKEGWRLCMDINLTGVLHGTNLAMEYVSTLELMKIFSKILMFRKMSVEDGGDGGIIVNIASILGLFCAEQPKGVKPTWIV